MVFLKTKPITTCPQVIAEIHRHAEEKLEDRNLGSFWKFAQKELSELGLHEEMVRLLEMDVNILSDFGPTDTAIVHLSHQIRQPVLTEDGKLATKCRSWELQVLSVTDILVYWQQHET
jgi:predicted nucleic acid-binding protein